jgi:chromosome segregation ATPase
MSSQIEQITLDRELALQTASDERMTLESEIVALKEQAEVQHARALADFERSNSQRVAMSSQIEQITLDRELALQTASDERMTLESEIVALKEQFEKMSALAEQRDGLKNKLHQTLVELDVAKKQASSVKEMSNSMAVRLLAFGRDHHLVMEASAELVQKLETSETEISRLTRTTEALRNELQSNSSTSVKAPPTLGNIYKKLRFHRFYLPFLYKAVRNSVRNQSKRFQAKA